MRTIAKLALTAPFLLALSACGETEEPAAVETTATPEPMPMETETPAMDPMAPEATPTDAMAPEATPTDAMAPEPAAT